MADETVLSKLPSLPDSSSDKFWLEAEKYQREIEKDIKCQHFFIYGKSCEVICRSCGIGTYLTKMSHIKDGKLFIA